MLKLQYIFYKAKVSVSIQKDQNAMRTHKSKKKKPADRWRRTSVYIRCISAKITFLAPALCFTAFIPFDPFTIQPYLKRFRIEINSANQCSTRRSILVAFWQPLFSSLSELSLFVSMN